MSPSHHVVTAVLVAHEGARWLPETLKALLTQTRPAQRLVAVDTGGRGAEHGMLAEIVGEGNLLSLPRDTGYGRAVAEALRHPAASVAVPRETAECVEWVWLVHDDSAPEPDALECLLATAEANPPAAILGPKLRDWTERHVLVEAGVAIDRVGRRVTGLEPGEYDQGQHDGVREVMAVSTAGMLVRRDVWDTLGGLDVDLGLFRDDVDFGWRAYAAGHRVLVATDAVMYHAEASARGRRPIPDGASPTTVDRRNAMLVLLTNVPSSVLPLTILRLVVGSLLRALLLCCAKRFTDARAEPTALRAALGGPGRLRRARAVRARGRAQASRNVGRFQPRGSALRRARERIGDLAATVSMASTGRFDDGSGPVRRFLRRPGVLVVLGLTAVTLVAERSLFGTDGALGGGALMPAWGGASDLWRRYLAGWHPSGLGSDAGAAPYVGVLALLATVLFGKAWAAVAVLLVGSVPLAGLTAYVAVRRIARRRTEPGATAVDAWVAVTYALLPAATGAVTTGRIGTAVVVMLLPLVGLCAHRVFTGSGRRARRAAWRMGLLLAVCMAFVPLTWLPVAVLGGLVCRVFREDRALRRRVVTIVVLPVILLLPWVFGLLVHPSRFLLEAGLHRADLTERALPATSVMMFDPGGPGTPPAWVCAGLMATGLVALVMRRRRTVVLVGWSSALFGLLLAILVSAVTVTKGAESAPAWPGVALVLAAGGVLLAASGLLGRAVSMLRGSRIVPRAGAAVVVALAVSTPLSAAVSWAVAGPHGPLRRIDPDAVPLSVTRGANRPRMLVLDQRDGRTSYTVVRDHEPTLGEAETPPPEKARRRFDTLVASLVSGQGTTVAGALARADIGYVLVPGHHDDRLTRLLDAVPGLVRLSRTDRFALWRPATATGRLMLVDDGTVTPLPSGKVGAHVRIPVGSGDRLVLLAEPADGGWHARLNGSPVRSRTVDGWAQGYVIPAAGGEFVLSRGMTLRHGWLVVQAIVLVIAIGFALPSAERGATADGASDPPRRPVPRHRRRRRGGRRRGIDPRTDTEGPHEDARAAEGEPAAEPVRAEHDVAVGPGPSVDGGTPTKPQEPEPAKGEDVEEAGPDSTAAPEGEASPGDEATAEIDMSSAEAPSAAEDPR